MARAIGMKVKVEQSTTIAFDQKYLKKVLRQASSEVAAQAKSDVKRAEGGGRVYYNAGGASGKPYFKARHTASQAGNPPSSFSGYLAKGLKNYVFKSGTAASVRSLAYYSASLEKGAHGGGRKGKKGKLDRVERKRAILHDRILKPRPFLNPALDKKRSSIERRLKDAAFRGIQFHREKVIK